MVQRRSNEEVESIVEKDGGKAIDANGLDDSASSSSVGDFADEYPDGGTRAWLIVCGAMCCTFSTFGFVNAWGVFQSYYETHTLKDSSPSNIAWIGSIQYALVFGPAVISGRLLDLGYFRVPFMLGTLLVIVSTLLVAHCTEYWHFLLFQGISIGLGAGICFGPTLGIVGHWWFKRRGLALGLTAVGASIGGTVYPIAARHLIDKVGFAWTMRIMAFINLATLGVSNLTLAPRFPPKDLPGGLFNVKVFKSAAFSIWCLSGFFCFLGIYTVLTFIDVSAIKSGVSPDFSFYLLSIANASSGAGRLITGLLCDKIGAVNVIVPMSLATAMMTFAWPYAHGKGSLIAVAILYGWILIFCLCLCIQRASVRYGRHGDVGRRLGTVMLFTAVGALCGPPISGAINGATGNFEAVSYYAGSAVLVAIFLMLLAKRLIIGRFFGKF